MSNNKILACTEPYTENLRPKQETFAQLFASGGNATAAYCGAFRTRPDTKRGNIRVRAYKLAHLPKIAARIRAIQAAAAETTVISVRARMVHLQNIVEADPSELVSIAGSACRHCYGVNHAYQWRDQAELAKAVSRYLTALESPRPLDEPDATGGMGFRGNVEPHPGCPNCDGAGITRTHITPTDHLSIQGRALFKGVKQKANGEIEVLFHDQLAASDQLNKLQGAYVDKSVNINANINVPALKDISPEAALDFLESLKPTT